jgi:hypothetical protein
MFKNGICEFGLINFESIFCALSLLFIGYLFVSYVGLHMYGGCMVCLLCHMCLLC